MGAGFLSSTGLGFGTLIERAEYFPVPALDKNRTPGKSNKEVRLFFLGVNSIWRLPSTSSLAITAFGGPEGYFSLAITAFGAVGCINFWQNLGGCGHRDVPQF